MRIVSSDDGGIDLSATPPELRGVGQRILTWVGSTAPVLRLPADAAADPAPYDRTLGELVILRGEGPVRVAIAPQGAMRVTGSSRSLEVFARSFEGFTDDLPPGRHIHLEHFDGNEWVDPQSVPLVIRVSRS